MSLLDVPAATGSGLMRLLVRHHLPDAGPAHDASVSLQCRTSTRRQLHVTARRVPAGCFSGMACQGYGVRLDFGWAACAVAATSTVLLRARRHAPVELPTAMDGGTGITPKQLSDQLRRRRCTLSDDISDGWFAVDQCLENKDDALAEDSQYLAACLEQISRKRGKGQHHNGSIQLAQALKRLDVRAYYSFLAQNPKLHAEQLQTRELWRQGLPQVLMVAEKPSVARMIAEFLNPPGFRLRERRGIADPCRIFEFAAVFPPTGQKSVICVTSVIGHIFDLTFDRQVSNSEDAYKAPVVKNLSQSTRKVRVVEHLQELARGSSNLCLWLDADREGENIGFEVVAVCRESFPKDDNIFRAVFSALTKTEISCAFASLGRPNPLVAQGVDARQELDLRVGVSFSRLLTKHLGSKSRAQKAPNQRRRLVSYGPCQTPALGFCVARGDEIAAFRPEQLWQPVVAIQAPGSRSRRPRQEQDFYWKEGETTDRGLASSIRVAASTASTATIGYKESSITVINRPTGLNTVHLLKVASNALGLGPKEAMKTAEDLYSKGLISYPRTETTRYHETFDAGAALRPQSKHEKWGRNAAKALSAWRSLAGNAQSYRARDVGDHPPITPLRPTNSSDGLRSREQRLYDFVCQHFIASWLGDAECEDLSVELDVAGHMFVCSERLLQRPGWLRAMPWRQKELGLQRKTQGSESRDGFFHELQGLESVRIASARLDNRWTESPQQLTEAELVALMDRNGIGTDASISTHIQTIQDRGYVELRDGAGAKIEPPRRHVPGKRRPQRRPAAPGRYLVPTALGCTLIHDLKQLDRTLVEPEVRALIERECGMVGQGEMQIEEVLARNLSLFRGKLRSVATGLSEGAPNHTNHAFRDRAANENWRSRSHRK